MVLLVVVVRRSKSGNSGVIGNSGKSGIGNTVEPPNNGHIGDRPLVHCREVVPILEVMP